MKSIFLCYLAIIPFLSSCEKDNASRVDIYLLKSFTINDNQATNPSTLTISNAVLEAEPLVRDQDINYYTRSTTTFRLKKDIKTIIRDYDGSKAFAVTVNGKPVYFGRFHPAYLASLTLGLATIDPILYSNNELMVNFVAIEGNNDLPLLDKRNDQRIINAFEASGRLR